MGYQVVANGSERFLFDRSTSTEGSARVWTVLGGASAPASSRDFVYDAGYRPVAYQEAADGSSSILWFHSGRLAVIEYYDAAGRPTAYSDQRGWLNGSVASSYKRLEDGTSRILWDHPDVVYVEVLDSRDRVIERHEYSKFYYPGYFPEDYGMRTIPDNVATW